jgi:hypothetical protein
VQAGRGGVQYTTKRRVRVRAHATLRIAAADRQLDSTRGYASRVVRRAAAAAAAAAAAWYDAHGRATSAGRAALGKRSGARPCLKYVCGLSARPQPLRRPYHVLVEHRLGVFKRIACAELVADAKVVSDQPRQHATCDMQYAKCDMRHAAARKSMRRPRAVRSAPEQSGGDGTFASCAPAMLHIPHCTLRPNKGRAGRWRVSVYVTDGTVCPRACDY